ncbi:GntR family transcriptional regulator [Corynebacterium frankenforstense]|uniref:GntR family transcriptional regulator n=1 Tax=Corynebacterium TaxID=1716 RepID=UPI00254FD65A|nr:MULTISPECIES: GntR family transcriptional regulator [Corynebacterium]MDK6260351.1 GntR family transcriptional regulator [Corynebacterium frankenforstense]MDK8894684.1 GntR family transcriptional regulator [Corynebacterium sp. MSK006]
MDHPKYIVAEAAIADICAGQENGDRLPSEGRLCSMLNVSRITVRRALDELENEGRVKRIQGSGTFVLDPDDHPVAPAEVMSPLGFHSQMVQRGHRVESRILSFGTVSADEQIAARLGVPLDARVMRLERLRFLDGSVHHLTRAWRSADRFPVAEDTDFSTASLYAVLRSCGARTDREQVTVFLRMPTGDEAALLGIPEDRPRLASWSTVTSTAGSPIACSATIRRDSDASMSFTVEPAARQQP